ncbi:hypothetical protein ACFSM5_16325 [Lacibacterium aquatile]|uniref:Uncharacterized protein n=1 Tax=Lacibacterium aquatile TaxID=1168082 RepID=A0ABW5DU85_9PROT
MLRLLPILSFTTLLALPTFAQAPDDTSLASCHADGLEAAYRSWKDDPEETALIRANPGKVARARSILSLRPTSNFKLTFVDNYPEKLPCDSTPEIASYPESYKFAGLFGDVAVVSFQGYEYPAYFLVDMITGARHRVDGEGLLTSEDRRYLLIDQSAYIDAPAPLHIIDTKGGLRIASLPGYGMANMAWDSPGKLKLSVTHPYRKDPLGAIASLDDIGIRLTFPSENRFVTATFMPIPTVEDLPFGPPSEEPK